MLAKAEELSKPTTLPGGKIPRTVATRDQLAAIVGRGLRTIAAWKAKGMPGVEGRYDVGACVSWAFLQGLLKFEKTTDDDELKNESPKNRLDRLKGDEKEIDVARLQAAIVDVDPARRMVTRLIHEAKALLDQLVDRIPAEMPTEISPEIRHRIRGIVQEILDDAYSVLSQMDRLTEDENPDEV